VANQPVPVVQDREAVQDFISEGWRKRGEPFSADMVRPPASVKIRQKPIFCDAPEKLNKYDASGVAGIYHGWIKQIRRHGEFI
jgi:hypothetical protein